MENSLQPAFPVSKEIAEASTITEYPYGLTKREYFAAKAMQSLITVQNVPISDVRRSLNMPEDEILIWEKHFSMFVAKLAISHADALLEALDNK